MSIKGPLINPLLNYQAEVTATCLQCGACFLGFIALNNEEAECFLQSAKILEGC